MTLIKVLLLLASSFCLWSSEVTGLKSTTICLISYRVVSSSSSCDWILTVLKIWNFDVNAKEIGCHMAIGLVSLFFFSYSQ